jgi:hypothetical protein
MSGGKLNTSYRRILDIAEEIEKFLASPEALMYSLHAREEIAYGVVVMKRAAVYANRIDYLLGGDDSEESFLKRLDEELEAVDGN